MSRIKRAALVAERIFVGMLVVAGGIGTIFGFVRLFR